MTIRMVSLTVKLTTLIFITSVGLVFPGRVFAYDTNVAHPNIAVLAAKLYNQNSNEKLTDQEIDWIREGAMNEDTPTRWMNHFYDPVYQQGLKNAFLSAKDWAQSPSAQRGFSLGDKSWQRALNDYQKGNKEMAFKESFCKFLFLWYNIAVNFN